MVDQVNALAARIGLPVSPKLSIADQYVLSWDGLDGTVTVGEVITDRAAWIVIHADENGQPGKILGRQPVPEGYSEDVIVTIAAIYAPRSMFVRLYEDNGKPRIFESEIDLPILHHGKPVTAQFNQIVE